MPSNPRRGCHAPIPCALRNGGLSWRAAHVETLIGALRAGTIKPLFENHWYSFPVEDPVVKSDLEHTLKEMGFYADGSFGMEIVKIKDCAMLAPLLKFEEKLSKHIAALSQETQSAVNEYRSSNETLAEKSKTLPGVIVKHIPCGDILTDPVSSLIES